MRTVLHQLHRKHILLPLLVGVLVFTPGVAFAQEWLQQGLYYMVTTVFGLLVRLGSTILDYGLETYVFGFSEQYVNQFGFAIDYLWSVIRDLFNLTFIFGLVYIGFRLIFKADDSHARKALIMLIGAALLVNFSLFFSKAIVDFSNLAAYEVAKGITVIGSGGNVAASQVENGVAGQFLNIFGLQDIFDPDPLDFETLGENGGWAYIFGIMIVFMIAAFVFAAGGILLIVRFITLSILMIFSPIMFIGMVFPFFSTYSSMWWKKFLGQAFVAPAYIFMLYLSLYVLQAIGSGSGSLSAMFGPETYTSGAGTLMVFLVGAGFLIASLMVAQKMGAAGANTAMSVGKNLRQRGQGMLGRGAVRASRLNKLDEKLENLGFSDQSIVRSATRSARYAKFGSPYSTQDIDEGQLKARRTKARYQQSKAVQKAAKGGAKAAPGSEAKVASERAISGASNDQLIKTLRDNAGNEAVFNEIVRNMNSAQFDAVMKAKDEDLDDSMKSTVADIRKQNVTSQIEEMGGADATASAAEKQMAFRSSLPKATTAQLKALGAKTLYDNAGVLTPSQLDEIKKSDDFTETETGRIIEANKNALLDKVKGGAAAEVFTNLKDEDVAKLPKDVLKEDNAVPYLTPGVLNQIKRTLNQEDRKYIRGKLPKDKRITDWLDTAAGQEF